jgi:hypothetical protein
MRLFWKSRPKALRSAFGKAGDSFFEKSISNPPLGVSLERSAFGKAVRLFIQMKRLKTKKRITMKIKNRIMKTMMVQIKMKISSKRKMIQIRIITPL